VTEAPLCLLYAGFDKLDVAFQGALGEDEIAALEAAKSLATERQDVVVCELGRGKEPLHVQPYGLKGGYAFKCENGPLGEGWAFKANSNPREWNIFCSVRASALLAYGWNETIRRIYARLDAMGCRVAGHGVNRVDYALDFLMPPAFEPRLEQFVAHAHAVIKPHWGKREIDDIAIRPTAVCRGRRLESITIGKMPGRQICAYDKRREVASQRKWFWYRAWELDPADHTANVWRVELRAGKRELKDRWQIRTLADAEASVADVFLSMIDQVRYLAPHQSDSNVSRQVLHPLWHALRSHVENSLFGFRTGLLPATIKEVERDLAKERYQANILGNLAGLAVAHGFDDASIRRNLPEIASGLTASAIRDPAGRFAKSVDRARERLHFLAR
jgi:hypothetical protein